MLPGDLRPNLTILIKVRGFFLSRPEYYKLGSEIGYTIPTHVYGCNKAQSMKKYLIGSYTHKRAYDVSYLAT